MTTVGTTTGLAHVAESRSRPVIAFAALAIAAATLVVAIVAVSLLANTAGPASTFGGASLAQSYQHVLRESSTATINAAPITDPSYQHVLRENSR